MHFPLAALPFPRLAGAGRVGRVRRIDEDPGVQALGQPRGAQVAAGGI